MERNGVPVPRIASFITMGPETVRMLNLFAHKVVLCLHFEHFEQHLTNDGRVAAFWRTKEDFARGVPKILLEMMREYGTLEQGKWNVSEAFEYRYSINKPGGIFACLARFRDNLFVTGFTAPSAAVAADVDAAWLRPCDLLNTAQTDEFRRKR